MLNRLSLDAMFQALSDPARRAMVERLGAGPASVSELARPLAISLPAVSQHVKVLEGCGLIRTTKSGRVRTCRLESSALRAVEYWIAERLAWEQRFGRLGEVVAVQDIEKEGDEL